MNGAKSAADQSAVSAKLPNEAQPGREGALERPTMKTFRRNLANIVLSVNHENKMKFLQGERCRLSSTVVPSSNFVTSASPSCDLPFDLQLRCALK